MTTLYPLLLDPSVHVKVWGGRDLATRLRKRLPGDQPCGETWELHDSATIINGPLTGQTLGAALAEHGTDLIGTAAERGRGIPLLAKFIHATRWLSVQVHPSDAQGVELEGARVGKTEAWYVLAAEPGAKLVIGVEPGMDRAAMAAAIQAGTLEDRLVYADVGPGDVLYVETGTIHALGPGLLIYEIQQASDVTYRLYDWNRLDLNGQPRELHIDKGLAVANTASLPAITRAPATTAPIVELTRSPYFTLSLLQHLAEPAAFDPAGRHFHALTCIDESLTIATATHSVPVNLGQTVCIPASVGRYSVSGPGRGLLVTRGGLISENPSPESDCQSE